MCDSGSETTENTETEIKFSSPEDKVVSEVHPFLNIVDGGSSTEKVKPLQKSANNVATILFSVPLKFLPPSLATLSANNKSSSVVDEDGDLVLVRKESDKKMNKSDDDDVELNLFIEYENSTTLDLVGLQIWRGAFLLSDFIVHFADMYFKGRNVLELGAGTGLVGIVASVFANGVTLTDINEPSILDLLQANLSHNREMIGKSMPKIMALNFMDLNWSSELQEIISLSDVIVAADVIYHVNITNAFIRTLQKILNSSVNAKHIFIGIEKRYIFTFSDLDAVAPMHNHFLEEVDNILGISPGSLPRPLNNNSGISMEISMSILPLDFKQYFNYERSKELILYHIKLRPI